MVPGAKPANFYDFDLGQGELAMVRVDNPSGAVTLALPNGAGITKLFSAGPLELTGLALQTVTSRIQQYINAREKEG